MHSANNARVLAGRNNGSIGSANVFGKVIERTSLLAGTAISVQLAGRQGLFGCGMCEKQTGRLAAFEKKRQRRRPGCGRFSALSKRLSYEKISEGRASVADSLR